MLVRCPSCGTKIDLPDDFNRQTTACPRCSHTFTHSQHPYRASDFARGGSGKISLLISLLALIVASTALYLQWHVPGKVAGLAKYDLTTPEAALRSKFVINANEDILAQMELALRTNQPPHKEKLRTLNIKKTINLDSSTSCLLYSYEVQGVKKVL